MESRQELKKEIRDIEDSISKLERIIKDILRFEGAENIEQLIGAVDNFRAFCAEGNKDELPVIKWSDFKANHLSPIAAAMGRYWQPRLDQVKMIRNKMHGDEAKGDERAAKRKLGKQLQEKQEEKEIKRLKGKEEDPLLEADIARLKAGMQTGVIREEIRERRKQEIYEAEERQQNLDLEAGGVPWFNPDKKVMTAQLETIFQRDQDVLKTLKTLLTVDMQTHRQGEGILYQLEARKRELLVEKQQLERKLARELAKDKHKQYKDIQQIVELVRGKTLTVWVSDKGSGGTMSLALPFPNPELAALVLEKLRDHIPGRAFRATQLGREKSASILFISSLDTELINILNALLAPNKITIGKTQDAQCMVFPLKIGENMSIKMDDLIAKLDIVPKEPELPPDEPERKEKKAEKAAPKPSAPDRLVRPSPGELPIPRAPAPITPVTRETLMKGNVGTLFAKTDLTKLSREVQSSAKTAQPEPSKAKKKSDEKKDKRKKSKSSDKKKSHEKKSSEHKGPRH